MPLLRLEVDVEVGGGGGGGERVAVAVQRVECADFLARAAKGAPRNVAVALGIGYEYGCGGAVAGEYVVWHESAEWAELRAAVSAFAGVMQTAGHAKSCVGQAHGLLRRLQGAGLPDAASACDAALG